MDYMDIIFNEIRNQKIIASKMEEDLNLGKGMITAWKRGSQPTVEKLIKVIKYLGLSADEVFGISSPINRTEKTLLISKFQSDLKFINNYLSILIGEDDVYGMIRDADVLKGYIEKQMAQYKKIDSE